MGWSPWFKFGLGTSELDKSEPNAVSERVEPKLPRGWRPAQQPDGQRTWGGSVAGADKRISAGNDD